MKQIIDYTGKRFNRLSVLGFSHKNDSNNYWECVCDCGTIRLLPGYVVSLGKQISCGCYHKEVSASLFVKHGKYYHPIYSRWQAMKSRCNAAYNISFANYGGRGISYCEEWEKFENFYNDMIEGFDVNLELDRIDVNGDYCKENCRWVTRQLNSYNKQKMKRNTSGKTGVSWSKKRNKWHSYIFKDHIKYDIGHFENYKDAVEARVLAELDLYGFVKE